MSNTVPANEPECIARDYVFAGLRTGIDGKPLAAICQIIDGKIAAETHYKASFLKGGILGGIYRGAYFYDGGSKGLPNATWVGRWGDAADNIGWRARHEAAEASVRLARLSADSKRVNELEAMLLPLRRLYASYNKQYDHAGKEALEQALLRALRAAPRRTEID